MKLILSHPTANANVRAAAQGFLQREMLLNFNTAIATFPGSIVDKIASLGLFPGMHRRAFDSRMAPITNTWPIMEIGRLTATKLGLTSLIKHDVGLFSVNSVYKYQDRKVARLINKLKNSQATAVYAYEDGAAESFKIAKNSGLKCVYDLPIGYWRAAREIMQEERSLKPEWANTIKGFDDSREKLKRKDDEIKDADLIIVASNFTAETLKYYPGTLPPVKVLPYGFPEVGTLKKYNFPGRKKLKLLFVGGLSQRKGIAYLFEAVHDFGPKVDLTIVGKKLVPDCSVLNNTLKRHNWIPSLPHKQILAIMKESDLLIFPSLFEGFGLVITEAMAQGTPVITTARTAGPDLIRHKENGWIIKAGSSDAIREVLHEIFQEPEIIESVGKAAFETAKKRTWKDYGEELAIVVATNCS